MISHLCCYILILFAGDPQGLPKTKTAQLFAPAPRTGVNLDGVNYYSAAFPFKDVMKTAEFPWRSANADGSGPFETSIPVPVDGNGYPVEVPFTPQGGGAPQLAHSLIHRGTKAGPNQDLYYPAGNYTLVLQGDGEVELGFDASGTYASPGTYTVPIPNPSDSGIWVKIKRSSVSDPIRNIQLYLPGYNNNNGGIANPEFLRRMAGVDVVRFMNWTERFLKDSTGSYISQLSWNQWPDQNFVSYAHSQAGVPPEIVAMMANEAGADAWVCLPYAADDNFFQSFAQALFDHLDPNLKVYVAYSNEVWNGNFPQNWFAADQGCALGLAGDCTDGINDNGDRYESALAFQVMRSAKLFEVFEGVFPGNRLVKVIESQAAVSFASDQLLLAQFSNPAIVTNGQFPDALAIAPYAGGTIGDRADIFTLTKNQILDLLEQDIQAETAVETASQRAVADQYGVSLIAYEGGQHLVSNNYNDDDSVNQKLIDANRDPRMEQLTREYFSAWRDHGGELFCYYHYVGGAPSKWGSWGVLENLLQPANQAPKYRSLRTEIDHPDADLLPYGFGGADCEGYAPRWQWSGDVSDFTLTLAGAPPDGTALLLVSPAKDPSGFTWQGLSLFPDLFDPFLTIFPLGMDGNGAWQDSFQPPAFSGFVVTMQAVVPNGNCLSQTWSASGALDLIFP